ncbi:MAG: ankyrin repeat domain-containing protein [Thermodesulfobacteriota bacterium]
MSHRVILQLGLAIVFTGTLTSAIADVPTHISSSSDVSVTAGFRRSSLAGPLGGSRGELALKNMDPDEPSSLNKQPALKKAVPWTDLMQASADGDDESLRRLLAAGAYPNTRSSNGWTPLMWASDGGHSDAVKILMDHGANVELADERGTTPLMLAVMRRMPGVADLLLDRKASPNAADKNGVTPLMIASSKGDNKTVRRLLDLGAQVDARDKSGRTALMRATNIPVAEILIQRGADIHARTYNGKTPLMAAAEGHRDKVIVALLERGADIHAKDNDGRTAREWGQYCNYGGIEDHHGILEILSEYPDKDTLCKAVISGREDAVAEFVRAGLKTSDLENCGDADALAYGTPLWWAVKTGRLGIVKLLLENGAPVLKDAGDLVYAAAADGRADILKLLIEYGALPTLNRNVRDWKDLCKHSSKEIVELLRRYDSKLCASASELAESRGCAEIVTDYGREKLRHYDAEKGVTPELIRMAGWEEISVLKCLLDAAKSQGIPSADFKGAMVGAARRDRLENIALLHEYGAHVDQPDDKRGITPLMWASADGNTEAVRTLIKYGANIHARSNEEQTALMYAQAHGFLEITELLKKYGARNDATLAGAAAMGDLGRAEKLLRNGENINASDALGWTPLLWACATGQTEMVRFLLERGAQTEARGQVLYSYPEGRGGYVGRFSPLEVAAHNGHPDAARLLMAHRKESTPANDGRDVAGALQIAAEKGHLSVVKAIVENGGDVNASTPRDEVVGSAALLAGARAGHTEIVEYLLEHGADPNSYEEPQGDSYYAPTPLDMATEKRHMRIRQLLLRFGADYAKQLDNDGCN